jgi:hypothetical protein
VNAVWFVNVCVKYLNSVLTLCILLSLLTAALYSVCHTVMIFDGSKQVLQ